MTSTFGTLGQIALSLSGGGYRAAAFHLGTLEMLDELGLLDDVNVLSTVSGGSITGAAFAMARADGLPFGQFRDRLYSFMRGTNVITRALNGLDDSANINGGEAMPSLIRAAADVYGSKLLFGDRTLDSLRTPHLRLDEVVINATDFHGGNSFRFGVSMNPNVRSGVAGAEIDPAINGTIRIADVVAASACFPSGFEPIRFPSDFRWPANIDLQQVKSALGPKFAADIPLMDGGVFDNQGIDSIRNVCERKGANIGVYIISDTSQRSGNLLDFPIKPRRGLISIGVWYWLIVGLAALSFAAMLTAAWDFGSMFYAEELNWYRLIVSQLVPFLLSATVFLLVVYGRYRFKQAAAEVKAKTGVSLWESLNRLTIPEFTELVDSRVRSVIAMTSSVFMKRLRALAFESVFANPNMTKKLIPNLIYDIDNESRWGDEMKKAGLAPCDNLRALACKAESYATNLWFLDATDLDDLIRCGRATMCFKMLKYLLRQKPTEILDSTKPEYALFQNAKNLWQQINR